MENVIHRWRVLTYVIMMSQSLHCVCQALITCCVISSSQAIAAITFRAAVTL